MKNGLYYQLDERWGSGHSVSRAVASMPGLHDHAASAATAMKSYGQGAGKLPGERQNLWRQTGVARSFGRWRIVRAAPGRTVDATRGFESKA